MCIRNKVLSLLYKIALLVLFGWALGSLCFPGGRFELHMLTYFSVQAGIFCLLFLVFTIFALLIDMNKKGIKGAYTYAYPLKGGVMATLLFCLLVYVVMLAGTPFDTTIYSNTNASMLLHYVLPILFSLDWLLFDRKGRYKPGDPFYWLALPFFYGTFYCIYTFVLSPASKSGFVNDPNFPFPYPFLDANLIGWGQVILNFVLLAASFLALSYLIFALDRIFGHYIKKQLIEEPGAPETTFTPPPPQQVIAPPYEPASPSYAPPVTAPPMGAPTAPDAPQNTPPIPPAGT